MSFILRPYQHGLIEKARELMQAGQKSILLQSPTGSGKTAVTAHMLGTAASKGMASYFIVHRRELVKQSTRAFSRVGVNHGIVASGFMEDTRPLTQIASIGTLVNRWQRYARPSLIIWDECHHLAASSWEKIFKEFSHAFHIGVTATPQRLDGKGLDKYFKAMINGPSVRWLIDNGFLSDYVLYAPSTPTTAGLHTRMGDYIQAELEQVMDKPTITGDVIKQYRKHADGKRAVVFCVSIKHSEHVVKQFNEAGIRAAHVDGETNKEIRDQTIKDFEDGKIEILSNVNLFGEGFDLPALEAVILLRPTKSLGFYLQMVGRVLRPMPGKTAIILDHAGLWREHGLPDEDREWSLQGRIFTKREKKEQEVSVKVCSVCFAAQPADNEDCEYCGAAFPKKIREVEVVDGELTAVDKDKARMIKREAQYSADTFEQLVELAKKRGYRQPYGWAKHIFNARQAKKNRGY